MPLCGLTVVGCSVMVAAKFFDDIYYDNAYYAKVRIHMSCMNVSFLTWLAMACKVIVRPDRSSPN